MKLKRDMKKAYDRVEWDFLEAVMLKLGFCEGWVSLVTKCVSFVKCNLLLEGKVVADFLPKRGLRQGDPLSPYLFILMADVLSSLVCRACDLKQLKGIRIARGCPELSHLFFVDDALFFIRALVENYTVMRDILDVHCKASGQDVNLDKSGLFFSTNAGQDVRDAVCASLGISDQRAPGLYLGLPAVWERSKVSALQFVVDKLMKKIGGWKYKFLSQAGREVLIKAECNVVPSYAMNCFKFPKSAWSLIVSFQVSFGEAERGR